MPSNHCEICGKYTKGFHFGVKSCRACAAFFRRALIAPKPRKSCKFEGNCQIFNGTEYTCKSCRLEKCRKAGMQGEAGLEEMASKSSANCKQLQLIPRSVEKFVGRPSLVIFCPRTTPTPRTFVNVKNLINEGFEILKTQNGTPWNSNSQLEKLYLGSEKYMNFSKHRFLTKITKKETMEMWQHDFLSTATWLTHFDEFRKLPDGLQMKMLQSIWHIWGRLLNFAQTVKLKKSLEPGKDGIMCSAKTYVDLKNLKFDVSWLSSYPAEQLFSFLMSMDDGKFEFDHLIDMITKLEPTDIELTFMLAQLCFEYAGNRHVGEIREISEKFQKILADDLHNYYYSTSVKNAKSVNYAGRLSQMLKINREVQQAIRRFREKTHIARTFDIFTAEYSHPEMFTDFGC